MKLKNVILWSILLLFCTSSSLLSQAQDNSCLNQLMPCVQYINSKKTPSSSCCDPLRSLIKSDPRCLCDMLGGGATGSINMTQAMQLPSRCGEKVNAAMCKAGSSPKRRSDASSSAGEMIRVAEAAIVVVLSIVIHTLWL